MTGRRPDFRRLAAASALPVLILLQAPAATAEPDDARRAALLHLLDHDCGSCHGMTRRGGLGPALLPDSLAGRSDETLATIILDGLPGTAMPPWRPELSEEDTAWLIHLLRKGPE